MFHFDFQKNLPTPKLDVGGQFKPNGIRKMKGFISKSLVCSV